jgi:hypothetical protein
VSRFHPAVMLAFVALSGCEMSPSDFDAAAMPDAGAVGPSLPALPRLTPCPAGWSTAMRDEIAICEPSPEETERCEGARFRLPGARACEPVDDACEDGEFPTVLEGPRAIRHVRAGSLGGDGSAASPFGTIEEAIAGASGPITVALAAGEHVTPRELPDDLELRGVCADRVVLTADAERPALRVRRGERLALDGVTIRAGNVALLVGGEAALRAVSIEGAASAGIGLIGGALTAERVLVRGTRTAPDGRLGRGMSLETGARATLRDVVIEGSHDGGLGMAGSSLEADDLAIRDTEPNGSGRYGYGLGLFDGARAAVTRLAVERATESGVRVDDGSELTLEGAVLRDVVSEASMANGRGLFVRRSTAHLDRVLVERASGSAIYLTSGSNLDARDVVAVATRPSDGFANGLGVLVGSSAQIDRLAVIDAAWMGIVAVSPGTSLDARDVLVRRVEESRELGEGIVAGDGAAATLERVLVEDTRAIGVLGWGAGSTLSITEGRIRRVRDTATYLVGRGAEADVGAHLTLTNVWIEDVIDTGIVSFGELRSGTLATLDRVRISGLRERSCVSSTCPTEGGGSAVAAVFSGAVVARGLEVIGAPLCGVQVAEGGSLDVESGSIRQSAIGACVQIEGYDLARVVAGVEYRDNERNVESSGVYVPGAGPR